MITDEQIKQILVGHGFKLHDGDLKPYVYEAAKALISEVMRPHKTLRPIDDYHEDYGDVLWWTNPVCEPPYIGNPLCCDWPGYHTHWTPFITPNEESRK